MATIAPQTMQPARQDNGYLEQFPERAIPCNCLRLKGQMWDKNNPYHPKLNHFYSVISGEIAISSLEKEIKRGFHF